MGLRQGKEACTSATTATEPAVPDRARGADGSKAGTTDPATLSTASITASAGKPGKQAVSDPLPLPPATATSTPKPLDRTAATGLAVLAEARTGESAEKAGKGEDCLVDRATLMQVRGKLSVTGRYCADRSLFQDYTLDSKVVGSGMSGPVQLATSKKSPHKVAVKSFKKSGLSSKKRLELKSEVEIYLSLDHPHIAQLERVYESPEEIHLVMEFMAGGELYDRLSALKKYREEDAATTAYMMLLAVSYLHSHQLAHRDLKLENFLYEAKEGPQREHLKLIDFGFAKFWDHNTKMSQACGSVHYVAPEVLRHSYTEKADMWSLGVIIYMLLTGSPPFFGSDEEVIKKIKAGQPHWSSRFHKLSAPARNFVKNLMVLDPRKRYSADDALHDEWIVAREKRETFLDSQTLQSLKTFGKASGFKRAVVSMMAWSLESEDRTELREMFLSMDKDNRGTITMPQMKEVLEDLFHINHVEAEEIFRSIDDNSDNEIAYSEFLAAACLGRVKVHEDLLRKTFASFDTEGTGKITSDNLKTLLGEEFEGVTIETLMKQADSNADGLVDYDEFIDFFYREDDGANPSHKSEAAAQAEAMSKVVDRLARVETMSALSFRSLPGAFRVGAWSPPSGSGGEDEASGSPLEASGSPLPLRRKGKAVTFCMGARSPPEADEEAKEAKALKEAKE